MVVQKDFGIASHLKWQKPCFSIVLHALASIPLHGALHSSHNRALHITEHGVLACPHAKEFTAVRQHVGSASVSICLPGKTVPPTKAIADCCEENCWLAQSIRASMWKSPAGPPSVPPVGYRLMAVNIKAVFSK